MVDDYIRREDAKDALQEKVFHNLTDEFYGAMQAIDELPPADVIPVVRCKDCRYFRKFLRECERSGALTMYPLHDTDFCSYGERREE